MTTIHDIEDYGPLDDYVFDNETTIRCQVGNTWEDPSSCDWEWTTDTFESVKSALLVVAEHARKIHGVNL